MEPATPVNKKILVAGGILLVVLLAVITAFLSSRRSATTGQPSPSPSVSNPADVNTILSYRPPAGARYSGLGDINFFPEKINGITIDRQKVINQAKAEYPKLSQTDLISTINKTIFYWLAMNNYYKNNEPDKVADTYKSEATLADFTTIERDYHTQGTDYSKRDISLSGFYLKVRFANIKPDNFLKLKMKQSELKPYALTTIKDYMAAADQYTDKSYVVDYINKNGQVQLMNNGDLSQKFSDHGIFPPLVSDPDYYNWAQKLLGGQFSDVITLKEYNPGTKSQQEYAYAVFYLTDKSGNHLPLNVLTDQFITKASIQ